MSVSIYSEIRKAFQETNELPYIFQPLSEAGKYEFSKLLSEEENLSNEDKERIAYKTIKKIKNHIENKKKDISLLLYIKEVPLCLYMRQFVDLLRASIDYGYFSLDEIYNFAIRLTTQSVYDSLVKLGILILGNFENDYTKKVMMTLGYHSEFTIYVIEASYRFSDYNEILEELLRNTDGYGKLFSAIKYKPTTEEQKKYMVEKAIEESFFGKKEISLSIAKNLLLEDYFCEMEITKENFRSISTLIAYSFYESYFKEFSISRNLIEKYISNANRYASNYIDLAAILIIKSGLEKVIGDDDEIYVKNGWKIDTEEQIIKACSVILEKFDLEKKILEELSENIYFNIDEASLMLFVLKEYQYYSGKTIDEFVFRVIFDILPFYFDLIEYFLVENGQKYQQVVYEVLEENLPEDVLNSYRSVEEANIKYLPDVWLVYILENMKNFGDYKEEFFIKCLFARFKDVRMKSVELLNCFKDNWSIKVIESLEEAKEDEPDKNISNFIEMMLKEIDIESFKKEKNVSKEENSKKVINLKFEKSEKDNK